MSINDTDTIQTLLNKRKCVFKNHIKALKKRKEICDLCNIRITDIDIKRFYNKYTLKSLYRLQISDSLIRGD